MLAVAADDLWDNDQPELWHRLLECASSPICEVLGIQQRQWLQQQLKGSKAALNVIASGSVLAGGLWRAVYVAPRFRACATFMLDGTWHHDLLATRMLLPCMTLGSLLLLCRQYRMDGGQQQLFG
jgi:hypothetical protein